MDFLYKNLPWGFSFATRKNLERGYLEEEKRLVKKYLKTGDNILIIGSGNGRQAYPLAPNGHFIVCVDIEMLYLSSGKKLLSQQGIKNVHFLKMDKYNLSFTHQSFDFAFFSINNFSARNLDLPHRKQFNILKSIHQILRPGGIVILHIHKSIYQNHTYDTKKLANDLLIYNFEMLEHAPAPGTSPEAFVCAIKKNA